ncbi:hypothetical protein ACFL0V_04355 [Nanoarchaeota archaeon]
MKKCCFTPIRIVYVMVGILAFLLIWIFYPLDLDQKRGWFPYIVSLVLVFLVLGILLIVQAVRRKEKLKLWYVLLGSSAIGIPALSVLHNVFYGIGIYFQYLFWIRWPMEALHVTAFLLSVIGCPLLFIVSVVVIFVKRRKADKPVKKKVKKKTKRKK